MDYSISSRSLVNSKLGDVEFWFLAVRKGHPILQAEITLEAILNHRLVFINNGPVSELNELVNRCCEGVEQKADISLITSSLLMAFERILKSNDVCWAPSVFPFELGKQRDDIELIDMTDFYKEHFKNIDNLSHPSHYLQFHETQKNKFTSLLSDIMSNNLKTYQQLYIKNESSKLKNS